MSNAKRIRVHEEGAKMRRLLANFTIIWVIAPRRQVGPKQVNLGTQPVGSLTFAEATVTTPAR